MERARRVTLILCIFGLLLGGLTTVGEQVPAQTVSRQTTVVMTYTEYLWWVIRYADNALLCEVPIDHEGLPTLREVSQACGAQVADVWWHTPLCKPNKPLERCEGVYLHLALTTPKEREVVITLPTPVVWLSLEGCAPKPPENFCQQIPSLLLQAEEPLPNERILAVQGTIDGDYFYCEGEVCLLPLRPTPLQGVTVEFWADSSYGDSSERFVAQVRVVDSGVSAAPGGAGWYVDVISPQWKGQTLVSCARIWEAFPPPGMPPQWLSTPEHFELLSTGAPYYYLAGRLISAGVVDASICPSGGLEPNGYANACGLEVARPLVEEWQNQFDARILEVANETGVPAQLLKNLFAHESQFWPGMYRVPFEFGLGQITDQGVDVVFLWNESFFRQFCPLVLSEEACARGYLKMGVDERALLRGALAVQAHADCLDCPLGIDLSNAYFSISLFANTLLANCAQVARTVYSATSQMAGRVATYEDLWRFTIANYHAGPGCVSFAIHRAWQMERALTWEAVAAHFTEPCQGAVPYVEEITR